MRSSLFKYFVLLFLGLTLILSTCALGAADPPVTPDTTIPPTLKVTVTIDEEQDASDGIYGSSMVTLQLFTNEIQEGSQPGYYAIFTHGESINCNGQKISLTNAPSYPVHIIINNNTLVYKCTYHYPDKSEPATIFNVAMGTHLLPKLQRPVPSSSDISVSYIPDKNPPDCQVQVNANAPNGTATGNSVPEDGGIYPGPNGGSLNVGALSGLGNIIMTRTCKPICFDNHNKADDNGVNFDAVCVTYKSTASYEVTWAS